MFDHGYDATTAWNKIDDWEQNFQQRADQAQALAIRTSGMSASARSDDRLVEVTVDLRGQILDLSLDEKIREKSAAATAREILGTIHKAKAVLIRQFDDATAETVGADTTTGQAMKAALRGRLGPLDDD